MWNVHLILVGAAMATSALAMPAPESHPPDTHPAGAATMAVHRAVESCSDAIGAPQRLRIRIVPEAPRAVIVQAQAEVAAIWRPYHLEIEWLDNKVTAGGDQPDLFVYFVDQKMAANTPRRDPAIAWIPFNEGVPMHFVRVSWPAAIALLETKSWYDGLPIARAQSRIRDVVLGRIVGRALAHEIGHYLLGSQVHAETGLMRASLANLELVSPGTGKLRLGHAEERALRASRMATCETLARRQ